MLKVQAFLHGLWLLVAIVFVTDLQEHSLFRSLAVLLAAVLFLVIPVALSGKSAWTIADQDSPSVYNAVLPVSSGLLVLEWLSVVLALAAFTFILWGFLNNLLPH